MKKLFYVVAILGCLLLQFCTFTPSGDYFEEIDPDPKFNGASITLGKNEDTLRIRGTMEVNYTLNLPNLSLYKAQFLLDDKIYYQTQNLAGSFNLQSHNLTDGVHEIKAYVNTSTNTNSLADKLGVEQLQLYQTWKILVDNATPSKIKIVAVEIIDGRLQVKWEKYKRIGFKSYHIYKHDPETKYSTYIASFQNKDSTSWIDHSYVGGKVGYSILVWDDRQTFSDGDIFPFESPRPQIKSYYFHNGQDVTLKFNATKLYRNFGNYYLRGYSNQSDLQGKSLFSTDKLNDTVVTVRDLPFGGLYRLELFTQPKENHHQLGVARHEVRVNPGTKFYSANLYSGFNIEYYIPETQMFYGFASADTLVALRAQDFKVINKTRLGSSSNYANNNRFFTRSVSPNGKYIYVALGDRIEQLNPSSLEVIHTYPVQNLVKNTAFKAYGISVSNNNRLVIGHVNSNSADTVYVIDMNQQKILFKQRNAGIPQISRDGKMLNLGGSLYWESSPGNFTPFTTNLNIFNVIFHPSADQILLETWRNLYVYSTSSGNLIRTLSIAGPFQNHTIDAETGHYGVKSNDGYYYIYNLNTGEQIKKVSIANSDLTYVFKQNKLFANEYFLPLGL